MKTYINDLLTPRILPILVALCISIGVIFSILPIMAHYKLFYSPTSEDTYGYAAYVIHFQLKKEFPSVIMLGPSVVRESTGGMTEVGGWKFFNLADSAESLSEMMAIFNTANPVKHSIIIIGVDPNTFLENNRDIQREYKHQRMRFLNYSTIRTFLIVQKVDVGPHLPELFYSGLWIANFLYEYKPYKLLFLNWSVLAAPFNRNMYHSVMTAQQKIAFSEKYKDNLYNRHVESHQDAWKLLDVLITQIQKKGCYPVIMLLPTSKLALAIDEPQEKNYLNGLYNIAKAHAVTIFNFRSNSENFNDKDFYDIYHFNDAGRVKFSPILTGKLISLIRGKENERN